MFMMFEGTFAEISCFSANWKQVCPTTVGNPHLSSLLSTLQPALWTAAHMHCRLDEFVKHQNVCVEGVRVSQFLKAIRLFVF